jgi:hypothetical protein
MGLPVKRIMPLSAMTGSALHINRELSGCSLHDGSRLKFNHSHLYSGYSAYPVVSN